MENSYKEWSIIDNKTVCNICNDKDTKLVSWIHIEQHNEKVASGSFKNYNEALKCYSRFDKTICVSKTVKEDFQSIFDLQNPAEVLYNTNESDLIIKKANDKIIEMPWEVFIC